MLICPAPNGSIQIHATGFVDIYEDRDVFDDLDQQIMMLTTEGGEEGQRWKKSKVFLAT